MKSIRDFVPLPALTAKQFIGGLFLIGGKRAVQRAERSGKFVQVVRVHLGQPGIGLHRVVGIQRRQLLRLIQVGFVGAMCIVTHGFRIGLPLDGLLVGDLQFGVQFVDPLFDQVFVFFGVAGSCL